MKARGYAVHWICRLLCILISSSPFSNANPPKEFLLDTSIVYGPSQGMKGAPAIASNGSTYCAVWADFRYDCSLYFTLINKQGKNLFPVSNFLNNHRTDDHYCVASEGKRYLVVFHRYEDDGYTICGLFIDSCGNVNDTNPFLILNRGVPGDLIFDGTDYFLVCTDQAVSGIIWMHITPAGAITNQGEITVPAPNNGICKASVAYNGRHYFIVWDQHQKNGDTELFGVRVAKTGQAIDTACLQLILKPFSQFHPKISFDGSHYCVAWTEEESDGLNYVNYVISFSLIAPSGLVINPNGVQITDTTKRSHLTDLLFDGKEYVGIYHECPKELAGNWWGPDDIKSFKISPSGAIIERDRPISTMAANGAFLCDSAGMYVVFSRYDREKHTDANIFGRIINSAAPNADTTEQILSGSASNQRNVSAIPLNGSFLAVWDDLRKETGRDIYGSRLDQWGNSLNPGSFCLSSKPGNQQNPAIATGKNASIVVWENDTGGIGGTLLSNDGHAIKSDIPISSRGTMPAVARDMDNFFVIWVDSGIAGKRINDKGELIDEKEIVLSDHPRSHSPAMAFGIHDYFLAWATYTDDGCAYQDSILGMSISREGVPLGKEPIVFAEKIYGLGTIATSFGKDRFLIVWTVNNTNRGTYIMRISGSGQLFDSTPAILPVLSPKAKVLPSLYVTASAFFNGADFVVSSFARGNGALNENVFCDINKIGGNGTISRLDTFSINSPVFGFPIMTSDINGASLISYSGWVGTINSMQYNSWRGKGAIVRVNGSPIAEKIPHAGGRGELSLYHHRFSRTIILFAGEPWPPGAPINVAIYNGQGRVIRMFRDKRAGTKIVFNAKDNSAAEMQPGIYFIKIYSHDKKRSSLVKKVVLF